MKIAKLAVVALGTALLLSSTAVYAENSSGINGVEDLPGKKIGVQLTCAPVYEGKSVFY